MPHKKRTVYKHCVTNTAPFIKSCLAATVSFYFMNHRQRYGYKPCSTVEKQTHVLNNIRIMTNSAMNRKLVAIITMTEI